MFGGKIAKKGERIEGTYKMHAYQDTWQEARPITYDGELTPLSVQASRPHGTPIITRFLLHPALVSCAGPPRTRSAMWTWNAVQSSSIAQ